MSNKTGQVLGREIMNTKKKKKEAQMTAISQQFNTFIKLLNSMQQRDGALQLDSMQWETAMRTQQLGI